MSKLFTLVFVLAAYATQSAIADQSLQKMGFVVKNMADTDIDGYHCVPKVWNDNANTYISYTCDIGFDDPWVVYIGQTGYMAGGVGTATSTFTLNDDGSYTLLYKGDYEPGGPLEILGDVLKKYPNPKLGDYTCTQTVLQGSRGFTFIEVRVPLNGSETTFAAACINVYDYLRGKGYLDKSYRRYSAFSDASGKYCILELWPQLEEILC